MGEYPTVGGRWTRWSTGTQMDGRPKSGHMLQCLKLLPYQIILQRCCNMCYNFHAHCRAALTLVCNLEHERSHWCSRLHQGNVWCFLCFNVCLSCKVGLLYVNKWSEACAEFSDWCSQKVSASCVFAGSRHKAGQTGPSPGTSRSWSELLPWFHYNLKESLL